MIIFEMPLIEMQKNFFKFLGINHVKSSDVKFATKSDNNNKVLQKLKENPI